MYVPGKVATFLLLPSRWEGKDAIMKALAVLLLVAPFVVGCTKATSMKMTASASLGSSSTDYKDSRFSGSTDDGFGYKLAVRVGTDVKQLVGPPQKGEPVGSESRPDNFLEAEAGYVRHGEMDFDGQWLGTSDVGSIKADGFIFGVVYTRRITDRFDLFANAGAHWWDVKEKEVFGGIPESHDASGTSPYFGIGGRYWLTPSVALRAAWERFADVGKRDVTGNGDIDNYWLGIDYSF